MFRQLIGSLVWIAANGLYIDMRRKGRRGFARILFFWMGIPATWLWLFLIPEGKNKARLEPPRDDYADLLAEIRRDRAMNPGSAAPTRLEETGGKPTDSGDGLENRPGREG